MRRLLALAIFLGTAAAAAEDYRPSPKNPKELVKVLDLVHRIESIGGAVQDLQVKETETEIHVELAADVLFEFDKADLRPAAEETLEKAGEYIRRSKSAVRVEGHTDAKGSDSYNERLSKRRAESVRTWFRKNGFADRSFVVKGWGAEKPVAPNTTPDGKDDPEGRQKNRRVEIVIRKP
jgi:outer membrane protein OmpA-like peptidoglycan-associated protein